MTPQTFIFIGRSGSGKGTQVKLLVDYLKKIDDGSRPFFYLEAGDRFREFIAGSSYSSRLAGEVSKKGARQPDFLAIWNWSHLLVDHFTGAEHLIIDGTPRSLLEAHVLHTAFTFYKRQKPIVVYLNVSREWSATRMRERKRSDDEEYNIQERLTWFDNDVMPAVLYFKTNSEYHFCDISGEQKVEDVHKEIIAKVGL